MEHERVVCRVGVSCWSVVLECRVGVSCWSVVLEDRDKTLTLYVSKSHVCEIEFSV